MEGTLLSPVDPDSVYGLLESYDSVADVFSAIQESRQELRQGQLHLVQVRVRVYGSTLDSRLTSK